MRIEWGGGFLECESVESGKSLVQKLVAVGGDLGEVKKDGKNTSQGFSYVSYEAFSAAIRSHLAEHRVLFVPSVVEDHGDTHVNKEGAPAGYLRRVRISLAFIDAETLAALTLSVMGEGFDSLDKAMNKAWTSGIKYGLMRLFLASQEGERDPDDEEPKGKQAGKAPDSEGKQPGKSPEQQAGKSPEQAKLPGSESKSPATMRWFEDETSRKAFIESQLSIYRKRWSQTDESALLKWAGIEQWSDWQGTTTDLAKRIAARVEEAARKLQEKKAGQ